MSVFYNYDSSLESDRLRVSEEKGHTVPPGNTKNGKRKGSSHLEGRKDRNVPEKKDRPRGRENTYKKWTTIRVKGPDHVYRKHFPGDWEGPSKIKEEGRE